MAGKDEAEESHGSGVIQPLKDSRYASGYRKGGDRPTDVPVFQLPKAMDLRAAVIEKNLDTNGENSKK